MPSSPALSAPSPSRIRAGFILLAALIVLFASAKAILYDTLDPDAFWHLRVAGQLQADGVHPLTDSLSFASIRQPWTPYSWLAELAMKCIWDLGGYRAAILVQSLMMALIVALLAAACAIGAESAPSFFHPTPWDPAPPVRSRLAAMIATAFGAYLIMPNLSFRPVTCAILLLMLCAVLLLRDRKRAENTTAVWWLIPIAALTTNIHFYAFLIPAWIAALLAGALIELRSCKSHHDRPRAARSAKRYALLLAATCAACCCTPMLPGTLRSIAYYQWADPMVHSGIIAEMHPFFALNLSTLLVLAATLCAAIHRHRIRPGECLWLLMGLFLLSRLERFTPLYIVIASPVLAVTLPALSDRLLAKPALAALMTGILAAGTVRLALAFPRPEMPLSTWLNRHAPDAPGYPAESAEFVSDHIQPAAGRIINEFSWGGYLAWRLGDRYQVLLDGRTQLYSPSFWHDAYLGTPAECADLLSNTRADAAILPIGKSRFRSILLTLGWTSVHRDAQAEVLAPPPSSPPAFLPSQVAHTE